ncbi:thaumatin-like protein [Primulina huaijiensis]|uniref:thaumatin-like protein n=1 Tax=Primulina huaijiensis TaxID=1492673 RepID=UPI003CC78B54
MIKSLRFFLIVLFFNHTNAITFSIKNNCPFTVWAAAVPGGGQRLENDQTWEVNVPDQTLGRIWARTGCSFNETGRGRCQTGDCNELLKCENYGESPHAAVRYRLNIFNDLDFLDVSLINGFNVPVKATPDTGHCGRPIQCSVDINEFCPKQLRVPGGCSDPCNVFRKEKYCCGSGQCGPTKYSRFFQSKCPRAYTYPKDDQPELCSCSAGTNYTVVFCP